MGQPRHALGGDQTNNNFSIALTAAQIGSHTAIRFVAQWLVRRRRELLRRQLHDHGSSAVETLNGGNGNDTYSFTLGDGNDVINELANEGTADRISILVPHRLDPVTGSAGHRSGNRPADTDADLARMLPTTTAARPNGDLVITYAMENGADTPVDQITTVAGHFTGPMPRPASSGSTSTVRPMPAICSAGDYFISRSDPGNRDGGGVNMSTNAVTNNQQNFVVGENGSADIITGGLLNDLIFGGTGDNDLIGGARRRPAGRRSGIGDDDCSTAADDADTMIGGAGNDTYDRR